MNGIYAYAFSSNVFFCKIISIPLATITRNRIQGLPSRRYPQAITRWNVFIKFLWEIDKSK